MTDHGQILIGNALDMLPTLAPESIHCSVSSPPYYALRRFEGDQQCDWPPVEYVPMPGLPPLNIETMTCALGHEPTIEAYVGHLVAIYREVWRVMRDDGVVWIVMGDSYASSGRSGPLGSPAWHGGDRYDDMEYGRAPTPNGLKQGDLMLVPHRLALALQADRWLLRNDVVWHKKAPMPESVSGWRWERHKVKINGRWATGLGRETSYREDGHSGDIRNKQQPIYESCPGCPKCAPNDGYVLRRGSWRHTRAHEFVLMLTKQMGYFANQEAVREGWADKREGDSGPAQTKYEKLIVEGNRSYRRYAHDTKPNVSGRNPRSVISPKPSPLSLNHFAAYPPSLIEPFIKATCPSRCCPECGAGWSPVIERQYGIPASYRGSTFTSGKTHVAREALAAVGQSERTTAINGLGHRPTCECGHDTHIPGTVLDQFIGSGTTAVVATSLGLRHIGIELSEEYAEMTRERVARTQPALFVV